MDVEVISVPGDERGRMTGAALAAAVDGLPEQVRDGIFAVVATAGTTNLGVVDDLAGIAAVTREHGWWFHVDGAYGGAALAAPSARHLFDGIEQADSFIVDPHNGCSHRSTRARCSTASRDWPARHTPSTPATSTRSPSTASGTRPTSRCS